MNPKTKQSITQQIVDLTARAITDPEQINQFMKEMASLSGTSFRLMRLITAEGITFMFVDDAINEYEKLLERLLQQEGWQDKFSAEYLSKAIQRIIATLIKEGQTEMAGPLFDQLVEDFETYSRKYVVYVPLDGIHLHSDSVPLGNIVLRTMTDAFIDELFEKAKNVTLLTLNPPDAQEIDSGWTKRSLEAMKDLVCAEFYAVAEPQRVRELAEKEIRQVLDLLRYAISVLCSEGLNVSVGLHGEVTSTIRTSPTYALDGESFELYSIRVGPLCPFELSSDNIEKMKQIGIFKVADILKQPNRATDFEKMLLRGIHWFSASQTQFEKENEFLNLMSCLETFFTHSGMTFISPSIAEQVADSTARSLTTDLKSRKTLKQRVKNLYGMRSGVSHGGQKTIPKADLDDLRKIAVELIFQMIERKDEFPIHKAFLDWLEERRLSG